MQIKRNKLIVQEDKIITFKEALGIIGFRKKDISKKKNKKTTIINNLKY